MAREFDKVKRLANDMYQNIPSGTGSGSLIVDELPEVGEEGILYEIKKNDGPYKTLGTFLFNTNSAIGSIATLYVSEKFDFEVTSMSSGQSPIMDGGFYYEYVTSEDRLYRFTNSSSSISYTEIEKVRDYVFKIGGYFIYVADKITGYTSNGTFIVKTKDGPELDTSNGVVTFIFLMDMEKDKCYYLKRGSVISDLDDNVYSYKIVDEFPKTGSEIEISDIFKTNKYHYVNYVESDEMYNFYLCYADEDCNKQCLWGYNNDGKTVFGYWDDDLEDMVEYTGELYWEYETSFNDVIKWKRFVDTPSTGSLIKYEGTEKTFYYVYVNNTWLNLTEVNFSEEFVMDKGYYYISGNKLLSFLENKGIYLGDDTSTKDLFLNIGLMKQWDSSSTEYRNYELKISSKASGTYVYYYYDSFNTSTSSSLITNTKGTIGYIFKDTITHIRLNYPRTLLGECNIKEGTEWNYNCHITEKEFYDIFLTPIVFKKGTTMTIDSEKLIKFLDDNGKTSVLDNSSSYTSLYSLISIFTCGDSAYGIGFYKTSGGSIIIASNGITINLVISATSSTLRQALKENPTITYTFENDININYIILGKYELSDVDWLKLE